MLFAPAVGAPPNCEAMRPTTLLHRPFRVDFTISPVQRVVLLLLTHFLPRQYRTTLDGFVGVRHNHPIFSYCRKPSFLA